MARRAWPELRAAPAATAAAPQKNGGFNLRSLLGSGAKSDADFLLADEAFVFSTESTSRDRLRLRWDIADDYYLYRDKVTVKTTATDVQLGSVSIPGGETQHDEYFGEQVVFHDQMIADVPVVAAAGVTEVPLEITYQGCADAGLCYPPIKKTVVVKLAATTTSASLTAAGPGARRDPCARSRTCSPTRSATVTCSPCWRRFSASACCSPLHPACCRWCRSCPASSSARATASRCRAAGRSRLSVAYVLGMALTYTIAGAAFAAAGQQAQAFFQKPWMIALFAALFVWLALGMFGLFNLQVPGWLQERVSRISDKQQQGTLIGTAIMGALSSLIVTACVAPPLVASLAVIGQSGDVFRGGAALFAMSLGMGAPLLLVGASAGELLPRAGAWMDTVKQVFGIMMLGVAIWMLGRILPGPVTLGLWAALAFVTGYWLLMMGGRDQNRGATVVRRGFGALAAIYGVLMLVGALSGRSDPLQPLAGVVGTPLGSAGEDAAGAVHPGAHFKRIKSVADLDAAIAAANAAGKTVMLDFYADWCVSCKEMEKYTFPEPSVQAALTNTVLLQADVTANDDADQALMQRFGILGPPSILFFGPDGAEKKDYRVVGFKPATEFAPHIQQAFGGQPQ